MLSSLPEDVLICIVRCLDPGELGIVAHACRALWQAARHGMAASLTISTRAVAMSAARVRWAADMYPGAMEEHKQPILCWAAFCGQIAAVEAVLSLDRQPQRLAPDVMAWASEGGSVAMLHHLARRGAPLDVRAAAMAALRGHLPALQWLWEQRCPRGWIVCAKVRICGIRLGRWMDG